VRAPAQALLVARLRLLDATRDRRAFVTGLIMPFVLLSVFGGLGLLGAKEQRRDAATTVKVAVADPGPGAERLLEALNRDHIKILLDGRPTALVARERADAALSVPRDVDQALAAGRPVRFEILAGAGGRAAEAIATTDAALRLAVLEAGGRPVEVTVSRDTLTGNPKAAASAIARTVPLLALIITLPFFGAGVRALASTRVDRSIEHLLPLPVARTTLLLGLALGTIGGEATQQILLLAVLGVAAPALAASGAIPWSGPPALLLALILSAVAAGSVGILVGAAARSERIVGLVTSLTSALLFGGATVLQFVDDAPRGALATAIPLVGPVLGARAAFSPRGLPPLSLVTMAAGALVTAALALRLAAQRLAAGGGLRV